MSVRIPQVLLLALVLAAWPTDSRGQISANSTVAGPSSDIDFGRTNGNRVAIHGKRALSVVARGTTVEFRETLDGLNWITTHVLSDPGLTRIVDPVIARDGHGNIGVAFTGVEVDHGHVIRDIGYAARSSAGTWTSLVYLGPGSQPSLAGLGPNMHLVWHHTLPNHHVYYNSFATMSPNPQATTVSVSPPPILCQPPHAVSVNARYHTPSVTATTEGFGVDRVLVAYLVDATYTDGSGNTPQRTVGVRVAEIDGAPPWVSVSQVYEDYQSLANLSCHSDLGVIKGDGVSVSIDSANGRYYVAWSDFLGSLGSRTVVSRSFDGNTWDGPAVLDWQPLFGGASLVDVEALPCQNGDLDRLRLAWSHAPNGHASNRGALRQVDATWATAFTINSAKVHATTGARAPDVTHARFCYPSACYGSGQAHRNLELVYELGTSNPYVQSYLVTDYPGCKKDTTCLPYIDDRRQPK